MHCGRLKQYMLPGPSFSGRSVDGLFIWGDSIAYFNEVYLFATQSSSVLQCLEGHALND